MPYSDEERQDFMLGQLAALSAFAQAVLLCHPRPYSLLLEFEAQILKAEAVSLPVAVSESYQEGLQHIVSTLCSPAAKEAARQQEANNP